jgi:hypothetical protein
MKRTAEFRDIAIQGTRDTLSSDKRLEWDTDESAWEEKARTFIGEHWSMKALASPRAILKARDYVFKRKEGIKAFNDASTSSAIENALKKETGKSVSFKDIEAGGEELKKSTLAGEFMRRDYTVLRASLEGIEAELVDRASGAKDKDAREHYDSWTRRARAALTTLYKLEDDSDKVHYDQRYTVGSIFQWGAKYYDPYSNEEFEAKMAENDEWLSGRMGELSREYGRTPGILTEESIPANASPRLRQLIMERQEMARSAMPGLFGD